MKFSSTIISVLFLLLISCSKETSETDIIVSEKKDYIIFGHVLGKCAFECIELYLLTESKLYEDSGKNEPLEEITFNPKSLDKSKYEIARTLWNPPITLQSGNVKEDELINIIDDFTYYISGRINQKEFEIFYDYIDSTKNIELYEYSISVEKVLSKIK